MKNVWWRSKEVFDDRVVIRDGQFYPTMCAWHTSKISMLCHSSLDPTFLFSKSIFFYNNFALRSFLHICSKTQLPSLPSQNVSLRSWECRVPTYQPPTLEHSFFCFQWGLLVAISYVTNLKFEHQRPLNPGHSFELCHVAKPAIVHARRFSQIWLYSRNESRKF
jgi:hypothetical protein